MRAPAAQLRFLRPRVHVSGDRRGSRSRGAYAWDAPPVGLAPLWVLLVGSLALAGLTLLMPSTPTYDPWAWILWGRQVAHLDLMTTGGPSWKPLPILFTTPFSLFGDQLAPFLWLLVARTGGFFACGMAYRLARRIMGPGYYGVVAGVAAALALFSSFKFVRDVALGNSEAILAAFVLLAFERHLDGRRDHALYLGMGAALLRPEAWPFLGLYGLWLWFSEPRLRWRMVVFALIIPALWFLPEWWGSGDLFRASSRANNPNPGSPAFSEHPALSIIFKLRSAVIAPVKAGVIVGTAYAMVQWFRHRREKETLWLFLGGFAWLLLVAGMTQAGYAGNYRYLIVTTAAGSVVGGVGAARVLRWLADGGARRLGRPQAGLVAANTALVLALAISAPFIVEKADNIKRVLGGLRHEGEIFADFRGLVDHMGGRQRLVSCRGVFSGPYQTQMVAYELHLPGIRVGSRETPGPGVAFRTRTVPNGPLVIQPTDDRFRQVIHYKKFRLLTAPPKGQRQGPQSCPVADPNAPKVPAPPAS
jgi:hypothetical protein